MAEWQWLNLMPVNCWDSGSGHRHPPARDGRRYQIRLFPANLPTLIPLFVLIRPSVRDRFPGPIPVL